METLQIIDTVVGNGHEATKGALLILHYEGHLESGTQFDSSRVRNAPFQFVLGSGRVIKGWDQGLVGMKAGGKRTLKIPSHLAYGDRQMGNLIPSNSNLIFHIELLEVRPRE